MPYLLHPETLLRSESEYALWFHKKTAETLELDNEGLNTLERLLKGSHSWSYKAFVFRNYLVAKGFIKKSKKNDPEQIKAISQLKHKVKTQKAPLRSRVAPEVLHLSLTDACQQSCSGCFFSNQSDDTPNRYMSPSTYTQIIQEAAQHKVFQIALGGGEPLMHPKLVTYVSQATKAGLVANLTSNGALLDEELAQSLKKAGLGQIQFSLNGSEAELHEQTRPYYTKVIAAIDHAIRAELRWGLNILLTKKNAPDLDNLLSFAQQKGAAMVNILRPKAAQNNRQWLQDNQLNATEHKQIQNQLAQWQKKANFALMTDTSYTFLREGSIEQMMAAGVTGCSAGRRMLSLQVDGRCSPCSHISQFDTPDKDRGFMAIWQESNYLKAFRELEDKLMGQCKNCELKAVCRGCRAVVLAEGRDFNGEDQQCPRHRSISSLPS